MTYHKNPLFATDQINFLLQVINCITRQKETEEDGKTKRYQTLRQGTGGGMIVRLLGGSTQSVISLCRVGPALGLQQ